MRAIGVDLHTQQITVCYLTDEEERGARYKLSEMANFCQQLKADDEIAVEATGNTRWFVEQVKDLVKRVWVVNPREFQVIRQSVKKTDERDAESLARFLRAGLLPTVRLKSELAERVQSLQQTREKLVGTRTALLNKVHCLLVASGRKAKKESLASTLGKQRILAMEWRASERVELEVICSQIESLTKSVKRLEAEIGVLGKEFAGFENLVSIKGIGERSAALLLAVIGEVEDFADENKLASYFGIVPRVSNSADSVNHGRITKRGSKLGRTTLVQCTLVAIRYSPYLKSYYERLKARRGAGKAVIATARKFLGIIYHTLKNNWVFEDFPNFVLAES
ncbi:MAG: IS110 family transposase [Pyrinomonadaceae bacterium]